MLGLLRMVRNVCCSELACVGGEKPLAKLKAAALIVKI